ncbi:MAG: hypothetical protein JW779_05435 [Candidatus Thorarchaeota archaeon]|nr:hypothetical protein [Candidatus Thorarchaeota archaeon]
MSIRVKRAIEITMLNYDCITAASAITYERRIGFATDNMQLSPEEIDQIVRAWNGDISHLMIKHIPFIVVLHDKNGVVAVNPEGATSLVVGTGKGVWFVCVFVPMDQDKFGIMNACVQAAKNLETSVSIFDI